MAARGSGPDELASSAAVSLALTCWGEGAGQGDGADYFLDIATGQMNDSGHGDAGGVEAVPRPVALQGELHDVDPALDQVGGRSEGDGGGFR